MSNGIALWRRAAAEAIAAVRARVRRLRSDRRRGPVQRSAGSGRREPLFGLIIPAMIYATGHLSGARINPAVTVAFTLTRHLPCATPPRGWRQAARLAGRQLRLAVLTTEGLD